MARSPCTLKATCQLGAAAGATGQHTWSFLLQLLESSSNAQQQAGKDKAIIDVDLFDGSFCAKVLLPSSGQELVQEPGVLLLAACTQQQSGKQVQPEPFWPTVLGLHPLDLA